MATPNPHRMKTPKPAEWVRELREEVAGNMTSIEATNHLIEHVEALLATKEEAARREERERIEGIFQKFVPPHKLSLEDSVWLKRLLNKAFEHETHSYESFSGKARRDTRAR